MSTVCYCGHPTCPATEHKPERCATACCDCLRADVERLNRENARLAAGHTIEGDGVSDADLLRAEVKERQKALEVAIEERESAFAERNWANERWEEQRAEVERLRGLIAEAEWVSGGYIMGPPSCPWCAYPVKEDGHSPQCPAFSARGEVRR